MNALRHALKEAGLPDDPRQVIGRMFAFTAGKITYQPGLPAEFTDTTDIHLAGIITGIELLSGRLCLFPTRVQINQGEVERLCYCNGLYQAEIIWDGVQPYHASAFGHLDLLDQPRAATAR